MTEPLSSQENAVDRLDNIERPNVFSATSVEELPRDQAIAYTIRLECAVVDMGRDLGTARQQLKGAVDRIRELEDELAELRTERDEWREAAEEWAGLMIEGKTDASGGQ